MPKTEILFQGIIDNNFHLDAIKKISELEDINELIFCVAFARSEGVELVLSEIDVDLNKLQFYLGVRNGITSAQALLKLVKMQIETYCIDTGNSGVLFHPKIYLSSNENQAYAILGSANLTQSGLATNIETSFLLNFDLNIPEDLEVYNRLKNSITNMLVSYPDNTNRVESVRDVISMLWDGIISDERVEKKESISKNINSRSSSLIKSIDSYKKNIRKFSRGKSPKEKQKLKKKEVASGDWILVWDGKSLSRRDLAIPKEGSNTHMTAQMNLTQGYMEEIDHQHYFRSQIFKNLNWEKAENSHYKEITKAKFKLIIKGIDYGTYILLLNHDTRTNTRSYKQGNAMTKIHWGSLRRLISNEKLLQCRLKMYESADIKADDVFLLEIV